MRAMAMDDAIEPTIPVTDRQQQIENELLRREVEKSHRKRKPIAETDGQTDNRNDNSSGNGTDDWNDNTGGNGTDNRNDKGSNNNRRRNDKNSDDNRRRNGIVRK